MGLLASIGAFLSASKATMTTRAIATVPVDWQVETQPGGDPAVVAHQTAADPHVKAAEPVQFATVDGLESTTGPPDQSTVQTTGAAQVLGVSDTYRRTFPDQFRTLAGSSDGVLLYQQTAANLHAAPGSAVIVHRSGLPPARVRVAGVIDIPQEDPLFQKVGAPPGAQAQAPPDDVLILPAATWHRLFDPLAAHRPDLVRSQVHARLDRQLPTDPAAAYSAVSGQARNLEVTLAGAGLVGDNVGAALAGAREDALYAQVLFLFLGLPGAVLAGLLTATVAGSGRDRRRREQALLRTRGAIVGQLTWLSVTEALLVGVVGAALGLGIAYIVSRAAFGTARFGATTSAAVVWSAAAVLAGLLIAAVSIALPAWRDARTATVAVARQMVGRSGDPRWMRWYLDLALIAGALAVFWLTSRNGYHLVLAVEGVPTISVSYWAFAGPALLWIGGGLVTYRLTAVLLRRGRPVLDRALRPLSSDLSDTVAASLQRQRRLVARGVAAVALTIGYAASTAVFNSTYRQQAEVDAVLTNGADVTAAVSPGAQVTPGSSLARAIALTPGVRHVEPLQHRYAYVGADLQDLYGVDTSTIGDAGRLQDAYFQGGSAKQLLAELAQHPDSILVSAETVHDFQLLPGDAVTLRLQDSRTKQYRNVTFHYVGIAKEFPTAPRDSFLVANRGYIAQKTGSAGVGTFLVDTGGHNTQAVARAVRARVGTAATVTDLASSRKVVGSSLTAVDLSGLTRVELGFALALAAAATGLTLWLGLVERRRTFAIVTALGATPRQVGAFVWAEALVVTVAGLAAGAVMAWALANMLVKVLTGVFDPPPATLSIPWVYLGALTTVSVAATALAGTLAVSSARRPRIELLRST
ncbi:FtsX-like permease family protein [Aquihabitans sp. McL0605]|uniref:FtsX-like permease family protein n=1 Tax=Aquihabitans sp. McL0605 TaxID=3415671 RepID=UPI003CE9D9BA